MRVTFKVQKVSVVGEPRFEQFQLNYPILKEVPLEILANLILDLDKDKGRLDVLDKDDLTIKMLGKAHIPDSIAIPASNVGLTLQTTYPK